MNQEELHALLEHCEWRQNFDRRTLDRGYSYFELGKVRSLALREDEDDADGCTLFGRVSGSGRKVYDCQVDVLQSDGELEIDGFCSCPVGMDCKHAVAVMRQAEVSLGGSGTRTASRPGKRKPAREADPLRAWNQWLSSVTTPPSEHEQAGPQRRFCILLRADPQGTLNANPAWLRPSKNNPDKLVDPKSVDFNFEGILSPAPADGWPREVSAALHLLLGDSYQYDVGRGWMRIEHDWQEQALDTLLARYPTFYRTGSTPLELGPDRCARLEWEDLLDGSQRLTSRIDSEEQAVMAQGAGLWYFEPKAGRFGRVAGDPALLAGVEHAPPVLPEQVDALRKRLAQQKGGLAIPAPRERPPPEAVQVQPVPVLQMRELDLPAKQQRSQAASAKVGRARLCFDYAGERIEPVSTFGSFAPVRRFRDGRLLEIERKREFEMDTLKTLGSFKLINAASYAWSHTLRKHELTGRDFLLQPDRRRQALNAEHWQPLLAELAEAGFEIEYEDGFPHDELVEIDDWHADIEPSGNAWFDVSLGIDVGGERIDLLPILRRVLADPSFARHPTKGEKKNAVHRVLIDENRSVEIPLNRLRALIEPLLEWLEGDEDLRLHRSQATTLRDLADESGLTWRGGETLRAQLELLTDAKRSATEPRGFKATLRPYQREGLAWLDFLGTAGLGGILADDMGLGKTVQVLAHIVGARQRKQLDGPVLVVAPTSLVGNWREEAARFAPRLKVLIIHGPDRADRYDDIAKHHLVITTYPLLARDREQLLEQEFSLLVLDEAQAIKNPRSQAAKVVREIPAGRRLAMTGTPLENHLGELWAQFDAVEPGLLGGHRQFTRLYRTPIEKHADSERQQRLNRRVGPLLLRRSKDQVLTDLPAKNEIVRTLELEGDQRNLYETLRLAQHERVQQAIKKRGLAQAGIVVLDALLKLRQACCDPRLVKLASAKKVQTSVKLEALLELIDGLVGEGRRILLFSQFTEMLGLIEAALKERKLDYQILTGQTPGHKRAALVKNFQQGDTPLFLISLKAGGLGLNLTAADTVIHYDPWWNPAVEAQATDRAHRIGQDKPVFVYRLIAAGTVEEKIQAMQARKADLARAVLEGGASQRLRFDEADLAELFAPL